MPRLDELHKMTDEALEALYLERFGEHHVEWERGYGEVRRRIIRALVEDEKMPGLDIPKGALS